MKSFRSAKHRLAVALGPEERADLARTLAAGVLHAAGKLDAFVVCDDEEVSAWAKSAGAEVVWTPGLGLSGAVTAGVAQLRERRHEVVVVAHADLPFAADLDKLALTGCVAIVPDLAWDGSNVVVVPSDAGFRFSYGRGSFERHRAEAGRLRLPCVEVHDRRLGVDIDLPEDLVRLKEMSAAAGGPIWPGVAGLEP